MGEESGKCSANQQSEYHCTHTSQWSTTGTTRYCCWCGEQFRHEAPPHGPYNMDSKRCPSPPIRRRI